MTAIGVHEYGHVFLMKKVGIKSGGFYFLPFIGGVAIAEDEYKTHADAVMVLLMGPMWGMFMAFTSWLLYFATGALVFSVITYWTAIFNIFNLIPIHPLDGGQIFTKIILSVNKKFEIIQYLLSAILSFGLFCLTKSILIVVLFGIAIKSLIDYINNQRRGGDDTWANVSEDKALSKLEIVQSVVCYLMLNYILLCMIFSNLQIGIHNFVPIFLK